MSTMHHSGGAARAVAAILAAAIAAVSVPSWADPLNVHSNYASVNINKVTGQADSFRWQWAGFDTQNGRLALHRDGAAVSLTGDTVGMKVSRAGVNYINKTDVTVSGTNLLWTVANTNVPPDNSYTVEFFAWSGSTNTSRTLAQGRVTVFDSLYDDDDDTYPWPSAGTNLLEYVKSSTLAVRTITIGDATGGLGSNNTFTAGTGDLTALYCTGAATGGGLSGSVTVNVTKASIMSTVADAVTNVSGNAEIVVDTQAGHTRALSIGAGIARDTETAAASNALYSVVVAATGGCYQASNPAGYVTAAVTNGLISQTAAENLTNGCIKTEQDGLQTVLLRSRYGGHAVFSNAVDELIVVIGYSADTVWPLLPSAEYPSVDITAGGRPTMAVRNTGNYTALYVNGAGTQTALVVRANDANGAAIDAVGTIRENGTNLHALASGALVVANASANTNGQQQATLSGLLATQALNTAGVALKWVPDAAHATGATWAAQSALASNVTASVSNGIYAAGVAYANSASGSVYTAAFSAGRIQASNDTVAILARFATTNATWHRGGSVNGTGSVYVINGSTNVHLRLR